MQINANSNPDYPLSKSTLFQPIVQVTLVCQRPPVHELSAWPSTLPHFRSRQYAPTPNINDSFIGAIVYQSNLEFEEGRDERCQFGAQPVFVRIDARVEFTGISAFLAQLIRILPPGFEAPIDAVIRDRGTSFTSPNAIWWPRQAWSSLEKEYPICLHCLLFACLTALAKSYKF